MSGTVQLQPLGKPSRGGRRDVSITGHCRYTDSLNPGTTYPAPAAPPAARYSNYTGIHALIHRNDGSPNQDVHGLMLFHYPILKPDIWANIIFRNVPYDDTGAMTYYTLKSRFELYFLTAAWDPDTVNYGSEPAAVGESVGWAPVGTYYSERNGLIHCDLRGVADPIVGVLAKVVYVSGRGGATFNFGDLALLSGVPLSNSPSVGEELVSYRSYVSGGSYFTEFATKSPTALLEGMTVSVDGFSGPNASFYNYGFWIVHSITGATNFVVTRFDAHTLTNTSDTGSAAYDNFTGLA